MTFSNFQTTTLAIAGFTAVAVGSSIALDPHGFYAAYSITPGASADLLSELRAPGVNLAILGMLMLGGLANARLRPLAAMVSLAVFGAFAAGRLLSIVLDGWPSGVILMALVVELVIAGACLLAFRRGVIREALRGVQAAS